MTPTTVLPTDEPREAISSGPLACSSDTPEVPAQAPLSVRMVETKEGNIFVFQPAYSGGHADSVRQFWRGGGHKYPRRLHVTDKCSLLANGFNRAWVHALNLQERGDPIVAFCMLHADVVPQDNWIDTLVDELLATGADLLSAVVPIKDFMGLTSCAIDDEDGFHVLRRITMTEVFNLPETFSGSDCGYRDDQLLVNTGCWICDFTKPWRHATNEHGELEVFFTIRDKIRKLENPGTKVPEWVAEVASEDWHFSRLLHRQGAKVLATRKLYLTHMGEIPFNNSEPWGTCEFDRVTAWKHHEQVIRKEGHSYLAQNVEAKGWLSYAEGQYLAALAKDRHCLEIGSYCGKSTIWMARTAQQVTAVDTFDGRATPTPGDTLDEFKSNLLKYGVLGQVAIWRGRSDEAIPKMLPHLRQRFELVFIDGAHDYTSVSLDVKLCAAVLEEDGLMAFHDYEPNYHGYNPDVKRVVDELLATGDLIPVNQVGSIKACRPASALLARYRNLENLFSEEHKNGQGATRTAPAGPTPGPAERYPESIVSGRDVSTLEFDDPA